MRIGTKERKCFGKARMHIDDRPERLFKKLVHSADELRDVNWLEVKLLAAGE